MITEVYLAPYGSSEFFLCDIRIDLPMPHSKSIIDITSLEGGPGELLGGGSKTITFPGTKNNNEIFGFIFEINLTDGSFNVSRKASVRVYQDKFQVIDGVLKLENINIIEDYIEYPCQITDGISNFYTKMQTPDGGLLGAEAAQLTDLLAAGETIPFDSLDHTYDWSHVSASWTAYVSTPGVGYVYPMIDYGQNDLHGWWVNQFLPAIYAREYMVRIFAFCGFTWSSNFLDSTFFKSLIIPSNNAVFYSKSTVTNRSFYLGLNSNQVFSGDARLQFDNNTIPNFDNSNQWNATTHQLSVGATGNYTFTASIHVTAFTTGGFFGIGRSIPTLVNVIRINATGIYTVSVTGFFNAGDIIEVSLSGFTGGSPISVTVANDASTFFYNNVDPSIVEGDTMTMISAVPINIKLQDFFESICKMFNLHIEVDPTNFYNLIIEPYDTFYNGALLDWTKKWDRGQELVLTPMGKLNSKNYLFTYTADSDYHNTWYTNRFFTIDHNDIYGERQIGTVNDFATDNHKTDIIFAPTPLVFYYNFGTNINNKILSTIHGSSSNGNDPVNQADTNPTGPHTSNPNSVSQTVIRILIYGGLQAGNWELTEQVSRTVHAQTTYPYAGHIDNPFNPTVDINFGVPAWLFYQLPQISYTNQNLYNQYYSAFMAEITDPESKVVDLYVKLNAADLVAFSFRQTIIIDKTYYKVLEIADYDLGTEQSTKVTLLKSNTHPPLAMSSGTPIGGGGMVGSERLPGLGNPFNPSYLQNGSSVAVGGQGNSISDQAGNVFITGDNNVVYGDSQQVAIHGGSGNTVYGNNVILVNCTNLNIVNDNVVYINNALYSPVGSDRGVATLGSDGDSTALVTLAGIISTSIVGITPTSTGSLNGDLTVTMGSGSFTIQASGSGSTAVVNWYLISF